MDEVQLMCDVEYLQTQLSHLGPVHEKYALMFMQSLDSNTLSERIMKLKVRRDHLQKMVDRSHATSTTPAVVPVVARKGDDLETPEKAAMEVEYRDPPQRAGASENKRRRGNAQSEPQPEKRRPKNRASTIQYGKMGRRRKCRCFTSTLQSCVSTCFKRRRI